MTREQYAQIREIAARNIERMRDAATGARHRASETPLNPMAVAKAVETQAEFEGYMRAVSDLLDGMIGPTMEET